MSSLSDVLTAVQHILLVDDEDDCNFVTKLVLKKAGYKGRLTTFTSADEALDHLRADLDELEDGGDSSDAYSDEDGAPRRPAPSKAKAKNAVRGLDSVSVMVSLLFSPKYNAAPPIVWAGLSWS